MKNGKLQENILKRSILKDIKSELKQKNDISGADVGTDCAVFSCAEADQMAVTTNVVSEEMVNAGQLAVCTAANNLACRGARLELVETALLLPGTMNEVELRELMKQLQETCRNFNAKLIGGHTEITRSVRNPIITVTGFGTCKNRSGSMKFGTGEKERSSAESGTCENNNNSIKLEGQYKAVKPGQDIVITKWVGLQGTVLAANLREKDLKERFPDDLIDEAKAFERYLSIVPEAATAMKSNVSALHDLSKGGVLGALWEMAEASGVGLNIDLKEIPIRQETVEICNFLDLNPYELLSTGSLMIVTDKGDDMVRLLEEEGIFAKVIGQTTDSNDRLVFVEEEKRFLTRPGTDEMYKLWK